MAKFLPYQQNQLSGLLGQLVIADGVVRTRPKMKKNRSCSDKQRAQRTRYRAVLDQYNQIKDYIVKPIWNPAVPKRLSALNLFVKENMQAFNKSGELVDPILLKMSVGYLPQAFNLNAVKDNTKSIEVKVSWQNDDQESAFRMHDELVAIFYNKEIFSPPIYTKVCRKEKSAVIEYPEDFKNSEYIFIFFSQKDRKAYSESRVFQL